MSAIYPLTLLYDADCPVCALEMDHLRSRDVAGRLVFIDIARPGFDRRPYGATLEAMDAQIHGLLADGSVLHGMEVLRLAYAAVGLGWLLRPTSFGPLRPAFDLGYRVFARHRRSISRWAAPLIDAVRAHRARRTVARMARCRAARGAGAVCPAVGAEEGSS